jgi:hypothetical protein
MDEKGPDCENARLPSDETEKGLQLGADTDLFLRGTLRSLLIRHDMENASQGLDEQVASLDSLPGCRFREPTISNLLVDTAQEPRGQKRKIGLAVVLRTDP